MTLFAIPSAAELEVTAQVLQVPKSGAGPGLHRMHCILSRVCSPAWLERVDAIKITGSKGKGTVSAMAAAILTELGVPNGLFISPHLTRLSERIRMSEAPIGEQELVERSAALLRTRAEYERAHPSDTLGAFELLTGMALAAFAARGLQGIVLEAGIGGRFDATRAVNGQSVALTSVELEHVEYLGNTPELIAYDKSEMCPANGRLVVGRIDDAVLRKLRGYCRTRQVEVESVADVAAVSDLEFAPGVMRYTLAYGGQSYGPIRSRLLGEHHAWNAAVAIGVTRHWAQRNLPGLVDSRFRAAVVAALERTAPAGRFECIASDPTVIIDIAHTPQSARAVARTVRAAYPQRKVLLVTGVSADKNMDGILEQLVPISEQILCSRAYHKGAAAADIAARCEALRPGSVWRIAATIEEAMDLARLRAAQDDMLILVTGGLFLAIEAAVHVSGADPRMLEFL